MTQEEEDRIRELIKTVLDELGVIAQDHDYPEDG